MFVTHYTKDFLSVAHATSPVGEGLSQASLRAEMAGASVWPSVPPCGLRPCTFRARVLSHEVSLGQGSILCLLEVLLGSDWGRGARISQTPAFSMSTELCWGVLIAFAEVWPPSGGISHRHQLLPPPSGFSFSVSLKYSLAWSKRHWIAC